MYSKQGPSHWDAICSICVFKPTWNERPPPHISGIKWNPICSFASQTRVLDSLFVWPGRCFHMQAGAMSLFVHHTFPPFILHPSSMQSRAFSCARISAPTFYAVSFYALQLCVRVSVQSSYPGAPWLPLVEVGICRSRPPRNPKGPSTYLLAQ